jgi:hypothetical protein
MNRLLLAFLASLTFFPNAYAAEPAPGDACTAVNNLLFTAGPEVAAGGGYALLCQGGTWKAILSFDSAAGITKIGNQTCATNEILKFNGTKWACAADASGSGGISALTGDVTASGTGSVAATIANNAVTTTKINNAAVTIAKLSATGTADNTTYLRGDGTWAGVSSSLPGLASAKVWIGNAGGAATAVSLSGDATLSNAGVLNIGSGKVTNTMLAGSITASKLVGTDIATVGAITTGTWNAGSVTSSGTFTGNGAGLTTLNASNLSSGTVPTGRLGSGTANNTTYLRGDGTWAAVSGGGGGITAVTTPLANCGYSSLCTVNCAAGYFRTGCGNTGEGGTSYPTSTNQCTCVGGNNDWHDCYAICSK